MDTVEELAEYQIIENAPDCCETCAYFRPAKCRTIFELPINKCNKRVTVNPDVFGHCKLYERNA